jgi:F-type H+-transporting ATPase subunit b
VTSDLPERYRRALAAVLAIVSLALFASAPGVAVQAWEVRLQQEPAAEEHEFAEEHEIEAHDGWGSTVAKFFNFAVLAGLLAYFLKGPIVGYLRNRDESIRRGLTEAAALRAGAEQQLTEVQGRLAALPEEVESLRRRGQQELAEERARLADATVREKQHVLDRTRREIDLQFRIARRRLLEHAAELSIARARARISRHITPDDQRRLIERYAAEVRS